MAYRWQGLTLNIQILTKTCHGARAGGSKRLLRERLQGACVVDKS